MMHRSVQRAGILVLLILMVGATGIAAESSIDDTGVESVTLSVGGIQTITPLIRNPLSQPDTITLNFTGTATQGVVGWEVTDEDQISATSTMTCYRSGTEDYDSPDSCQIDVPAQSSENLSITLEAQSSLTLNQADTGAFVISARSQVTKLTGSDSVQVTVTPQYSNSQQATALTPFYLVVILFTAMAAYWRRYR